MLTVVEARPLITTSLTDAQLQAVIEREERWLALRIGPLEGPRIERFVVEGSETLLLRRHASEVDVTDDAGVAEVLLRGWADVVLADGAWSGVPEVLYEPDDDAAVTSALVTLVRLRIDESAFAAQAAGSHSYQYDAQAAKAARWSAWRGLLRPLVPSSVKLASTIAAATGAVHPIATEVVGS